MTIKLIASVSLALVSVVATALPGFSLGNGIIYGSECGSSKTVTTGITKTFESGTSRTDFVDRASITGGGSATDAGTKEVKGFEEKKFSSEGVFNSTTTRNANFESIRVDINVQ
jgi:hypothetical protein